MAKKVTERELIELEKLEYDYFNHIKFYLLNNRDRMKRALESKNKIRDDWFEQFTATGGDTSESDVGTERIFHWLLGSLWEPNSSPIGSDLMFETYNAFVHIEVKTVMGSDKSGRIKGNLGDAKGKVQVGQNQTSYPTKKKWDGKQYIFNPNLVTKYKKTAQNNFEYDKPTLTYAIECIYDGTTQKPIAVLLICIPNGILFDIYKHHIVNVGKSVKRKERTDFRYAYYRDPYFALSRNKDEKRYRVEFLYFDPNIKKPNSEENYTLSDLMIRGSNNIPLNE